MIRGHRPSRPEVPPKDAGARRAFYRGLAADVVVRLLRQGDHDAMREFTERYTPLLLEYAERAGFAVADLETVASDLISDVARALIAMRSGLPRCSMEAYVARAFRNRVISIMRQASSDTPVDDGSAQPDDGSDTWSRTGCSEGSIRATKGPAWEPHPLSPALERLSTMLDEGLSPEERELLAGVSAYASQSEIAEWLGMSHDAARKQLERLRKRLTIVARRYTESLTGAERAEIRRFFRRVSAIIGGDPPPSPDDSTRAAG